MKQIGVGLLGFGTVGAGVVEGLQRNRQVLSARAGVDIVLKRIADLDIKSDRGVKVDQSILTTDAMSVIADPEVNIVVELIGGTGIARTLVSEALKARKPVITANKKLLAEHGDEIFGLAEQGGVDLYFGASVGGGIPIIKTLREGLIGNQVCSMYGILNGTCNYILSRMEEEGLSFVEVLKAAQEAGYAEANPSLDIDGFDTAHKAVILASLAYGFHVPLEAVGIEGITGIDSCDVQYAHELGYRIKLLAIVRKIASEIEIRVHPTLVPLNHMLASVNNVFNAVMVRGDMTGDTLYYGRGASRAPTASTVISDLADVARNLASRQPRHKRGVPRSAVPPPAIRPISAVRSRYYLRLMVRNKAGMLGLYTTVLGRHGVSILAVMQKEVREAEGGFVPVVALTHEASDADLTAALTEIRASGVVEGAPVKLRVLED